MWMRMVEVTMSVVQPQDGQEITATLDGPRRSFQVSENVAVGSGDEQDGAVDGYHG